MVKLKIDWCSRKAAEYAVMRWHYSRAMPAARLACLGVWEDDRFIGAVVFGRGANKNGYIRFGIKSQYEACELVRVALSPTHKTPVSRVLAICLKMLKRAMPGLRLVVSYADPAQGHVGAIYQATNWVYVGESSRENNYLVFGQSMHKRTLTDLISRRRATGRVNYEQFVKRLDPNAVVVQSPPKYCYVYIFDSSLRDTIMKMAKPYPKKCARSADSGTLDSNQRGSCDATRALGRDEKDEFPARAEARTSDTATA